MDNYLSILEDSLKQKLDVLELIQKSTEKQEQLLKNDTFNADDFDRCMDEKETLIQKLTKLDDGFESVYSRVKEQLAGNQIQYKAEINRLQELIRKITDLSTAIQVKEQRNKNQLDKQLSSMRQNLNVGRRNTAAIYNKYHNLNGAVNPQFMDHKQ